MQIDAETLSYLKPEELAQLEALLSMLPWQPQPGPQTEAYNSEADVIGYGGAAGGGKTDLALGFAGTKHYRSAIFRRVFPLVEGMEARSKEMYPPSGASFNEAVHRWQFPNGGTLRFAAMQYEGDKKNFQGRPFDFYCFDEATEFTETQVRFVIGWNRTTRPGQKCRVLLTFNPPMDEQGEWVVRFFAPWLDETHKNPAKDGELRWYSMIDGKEVELENGEPFVHNGETIIPKSRTFFHAKLSDNPALERTGYSATIDAMPEPLRSLLRGKFGAYKGVDPFQVIPSAWVVAAQRRWLNMPAGKKIITVGVDVARGGGDQTVFATLTQDRFEELKKFPGAATPDGQTVTVLLENYIGKQKPKIGVDVIGVGAAVYDALQRNEHDVVGVNFGASSDETDRSGKLKFANIRAEAYWKLREALDPDYGATLALPPDKELLGDLCSPKWSTQKDRIYIESKKEIIKRLGRSPDCADAVAIALFSKDAIADDLSDLGQVEDFQNKWS